MRTLCAIFALLLCFFVSESDAATTTIRQIPYSFNYDGLAREKNKELQFIFCSNCVTPSSPTQQRQAPASQLPLSIKLSGESAKALEAPSSTHPPYPEKGSIDEQKPLKEVTILFDFNSSIIRETEKPKLSKFAMEAKQELTKQNKTVIVDGYTCDIGDKHYNDLLARKRARNVASYLKTTGSIQPSSVTGQGKCCYATGDPGTKHLNRRVEVKITQKKGVTNP